MDIVGKRYGRLVVIGLSENRNRYVICKCDCGNTCEVNQYSLVSGNTRSCGCLRKEVSRETGKRTLLENSEQRLATNRKYNTNFQIIESKQPNNRNKSGTKGVWFDASRGVYETYISLHRKRILLGRFKTLAEAVKARSRAEEELFAPLIAAKYADLHSAKHES